MAAIARGYSSIGAFQQMLEGLAAAADAVADGEGDAEAKLSSLTEQLQKSAAAAVGSPILNLVSLFIAFLSLLLAIQKPDWADDSEAIQRRILASQEELRTAIRDLAAQRAELGVDATTRDETIHHEIQELADSVAATNVRILVTRARLHARPASQSSVTATLMPGDSVMLLRIWGRWSLVAIDLDGRPRIGWVPKKCMRELSPRSDPESSK